MFPDELGVKYKEWANPIVEQEPVENNKTGMDTVRQSKLNESAANVVEGDKKENDEETLVAKLKPIFYNHEENVRQFLKEIKGMATEDITDLVNRWVTDKLISDYGNSRKGLLWSILNEAGLYTRSRSNWNGRVN